MKLRICLRSLALPLLLGIALSAAAAWMHGARADDACAIGLSDADFTAVIKAYWSGSRNGVALGAYRLDPGHLLRETSPETRPVNPWVMTVMAGAVSAGWAWATIDGNEVAAGAAGADFVRAISDEQPHEIRFGATELGKRISAPVAAETEDPTDDGSVLYPRLGTPDDFSVLENTEHVAGKRTLRVVRANYALTGRAPNLEAYAVGQLAVAAALAGEPIKASPTTSTAGKKASFLLYRRPTDCRWIVITADVADRDKDFTTRRVEHTLACLDEDPSRPVEACDKRN